MALQQNLVCQSLPANADLSASQFRFVALNSSGNVILNVTAGGDCIGVLQDKPSAAGQTAEVAMLTPGSRVKVVSAANLAPGAKVQSNDAGAAIAAASGDHVLGTVVVGGVAGDLIEIIPGSRMLLP